MDGSYKSSGARRPFRLMRILVGLALLGVVVFQSWQKGREPRAVDKRLPQKDAESRSVEPDGERGASQASPRQGTRPSDVPSKVLTVLAEVDKTGRPLEGYEGGRKFLNLGRDGEQKLPLADARGKAIEYREWDVNPHVAGRNRGAERLVTGSDGTAYFTSDHYRTFTKIR